MQLRRVFYGVVLCLCLAPILSAQDAVKVDPKHYKVVSENEQVRILRVHYEPHEKSVMHSHPGQVAVFLTDAKGQFTYPDGKKENFASKSGDALLGAGTTHLPENTSDQELDLIVVELKGKPTGAQELPAPDDHAKVVAENNQARVLRYRYEPGDKSKMHSHPDNVQVVLADSHAKVYAPDGKVTDSSGKAGEARWRTATTHSVENVGDKAFEGILIELKGKSAAAKAALGE